MVLAIGIDLGTTYSCVGVVENGEVKILTNEQGRRITASCVSYSIDPDSGIETPLVGDAAKENAAVNNDNTIFCAKRLIGRSWDDPVVQTDLNLMSSRVIEDDGRPKFLVWEDEGVARSYFPEQVSAEVLRKMKSMAEDFLNDDVNHAVITVPAYFNENQKRATRDAARIAGLTVLDLLTEPNAAAIAYGVDLQEDAERTVLVFDFGGGTFDVSILSIKDGQFKVLAIGGDAHLGGEDVDNILACHFEKLFNSKNGTDIRGDNSRAGTRAWRRLKARCEKLKIQLSKSMIANIKIDSLYNGKDLTASLTRARFEELNDELFQRTIFEVNKVFRDSRIDKDRIHDVILVGGSTNIPKIQKMLNNCLDRNEPLEAKVNVDEAVALGATILAAVKTHTILERVPIVKLWDALPQSLGISTSKGIMHTFFQRNTRVPVSETMTFSTDKDNQTILRFKVYEGENTDVKKNFFLGEFRIAGIPPAPRGVPLIEVTFTVNEDCLLEVTAQELTTKRHKGVRIHHDTKRLTEEELQELVRRAEEFAEHNKEVKARIQALDELEKYIVDLRTACLREPMKSIVSEEIVEEINTTYDWIDSWHSKKQYPKVDKSKKVKKDIEDLWNPIVTELYAPSRRHEPPSLLESMN